MTEDRQGPVVPPPPNVRSQAILRVISAPGRAVVRIAGLARRQTDVRNTRHMALYVSLPFEVAPALLDYPRVVIPPRQGSKRDGLPPVFLRFHGVDDIEDPVDDRALSVATAKANNRRARRAKDRHDAHLQRRQQAATRRRANVAELETAVPNAHRGSFNPGTSQELADHCLAALNRFLDVYQVLTEQVEVRHVSPETLGPELVMEFRRVTDMPTGRITLPHKRAKLPAEQDLPQEHLLRFLEAAMRREPHQHPLDLVRRLYLRAARYAETGEYEAAIESLQTSAERLIFALHALVLVDQGTLSKDIEARLPTTFARALKELPNLLGGNWSTHGGGAVARYWESLYDVRNRITHVGVTPDRDAVPDAFAAYDGLRTHVLARTLAVRARYPRTALAVHGGVGLAGAGALDRRMKSVISDIDAAGEADTFWLPVDERGQSQ